jgi:hypothetical protein
MLAEIVFANPDKLKVECNCSSCGKKAFQGMALEQAAFLLVFMKPQFYLRVATIKILT